MQRSTGCRCSSRRTSRSGCDGDCARRTTLRRVIQPPIIPSASRRLLLLLTRIAFRLVPFLSRSPSPGLAAPVTFPGRRARPWRGAAASTQAGGQASASSTPSVRVTAGCATALPCRRRRRALELTRAPMCAPARLTADILDYWWSLADEDADGVLSAPEAVAFLSLSGLPREALARVWCVKRPTPARDAPCAALSALPPACWS